MTAFSNATGLGLTLLHRLAGVQITLTREDGEVSLTAAPLQQFLKIRDGIGPLSSSELILIARYSDLVIDEEQITPEPGDVIEMTTDKARSYRVSHFSGSEECYRFPEPHRQWIEIHATEIL